MLTSLIARKIGMSRVFLPTGEAVAVTYLKVEENQIMRHKTEEKDGYNAVVLGIGKKIKKDGKGKEFVKYAKQKEFKVDSLDGLDVGKTINISVIPQEATVTVVGTSKGKGFQGVIKRHGAHGGPKTHGSHHKREPGSIGMSTHPGRVHKGKHMPGRMGNDRITLKNRAVISADEKEGIVAVKGPVPGANGSIVYVSVEQTSDKKKS